MAEHHKNKGYFCKTFMIIYFIEYGRYLLSCQYCDLFGFYIKDLLHVKLMFIILDIILNLGCIA